ncbi:MAG TPA: hypothetical protein VG929_04990 [Actinomycetota bacterium]|nr:hypothetical protein [Actinomycetota bacterium]
MSTLHSLESAAAQVTQARLDEADRTRLVRSVRPARLRAPRRSVASALRSWADRLEPDRPCLDC